MGGRGITSAEALTLEAVPARELVGEAQLAVSWEAHPQDVAALVHAHPTQDEALAEAFLALAGTSLHAHT